MALLQVGKANFFFVFLIMFVQSRMYVYLQNVLRYYCINQPFLVFFFVFCIFCSEIA